MRATSVSPLPLVVGVALVSCGGGARSGPEAFCAGAGERIGDATLARIERYLAAERGLEVRS